jgi:hypothetical protein
MSASYILYFNHVSKKREDSAILNDDSARIRLRTFMVDSVMQQSLWYPTVSGNVLLHPLLVLVFSLCVDHMCWAATSHPRFTCQSYEGTLALSTDQRSRTESLKGSLGAFCYLNRTKNRGYWRSTANLLA